MRYETTIPIDAPAAHVWSVLADVASWPAWTPTVESVVAVGPIVEGSEVRIEQPGRAAVRYRVEQFADGQGFRWGKDSALLRQFADHQVRPTSTGCEVTLSFGMTGVVGGLLRRLAGRKIAGMVDTEAASLKAHAEGAGN